MNKKVDMDMDIDTGTDTNGNIGIGFEDLDIGKRLNPISDIKWHSAGLQSDNPTSGSLRHYSSRRSGRAPTYVN